MGPTASGKSGLAVELARTFSLEIVNADSVQVYQGLEIGSAKPSQEERQAVPHHLLDLVPPDQPFSAGRYREAALAQIEDCHQRGVVPALVGGTGFYFRAVEEGLADIPQVDPTIVEQLNQLAADTEGQLALHAELSRVDPQWAAQVQPADRQRTIRGLSVYRSSGETLTHWLALSKEKNAQQEKKHAFLKLALDWPRETLYARINQRFDQMMEQGFLDEVRGLLEQGYDSNLPAMKAVGYRALLSHLQGACSLAEAIELGKRDSRRYAKRQLTWLRQEKNLHWLAPKTPIEEVFPHLSPFLSRFLAKNGILG
uniref:tRNA dimethylallyltransferase n=1 Tax=Magnetococcus massalia (strain MO-1) TaxID=451514 RepID=A0A1S7LMJ9_MAGMO|nr:tRNA Delta(2)-isopentenylpyrophosphate transferase [Candidatus Magnetococcus massalia]